MKILADHTAEAIIDAPLKLINLTEWLFTLKSHEYQACASGHLAAGATTAPDGKRMSINVELVAGNLLVQHYVEEVTARNHCRVHSVSDSISPLGNTKLEVIWEIRAEAISGNNCLFKNHVVVGATPEFLALLASVQITDLAAVKGQMSQNVFDHNTEETPLFAKDIARKALAGNWPLL